LEKREDFRWCRNFPLGSTTLTRTVSLISPSYTIATLICSSVELQLGWYHIRTPLRQIYSLTDRPGSIAIRGSAYRIDQEESPAALLRKQPGLNMDFSTEVEFTPIEIGEQAGAVVFMDKKSFASVAIQGVEDGKVGLVFKSPSGNGQFTVSDLSWPVDEKALFVTVQFYVCFTGKVLPFGRSFGRDLAN
jgi:beta-xylosidase